MVEYGSCWGGALQGYDKGKAWVSDVDYKIHWCHRNWRHRILILSEVFEKGRAIQYLRLAVREAQGEAPGKRGDPERYGFSENIPDCMKENGAIN